MCCTVKEDRTVSLIVCKQEHRPAADGLEVRTTQLVAKKKSTVVAWGLENTTKQITFFPLLYHA